ncbi:hypothetical protein [Bacillus sp. FJAT-27445]|uniref:hypothetical protein n=1 Tax=Bacillus sp. FJAT-27445 TaxID=1679166 RepID=UPI0007434419|nr:hypothetical protein [Bacillus sp. FJAT-27445]
MIKGNKLVFISTLLLVTSLITWLLGNYMASPSEMDEGTSFAIMGFIGTVFFLFITLVLLVKRRVK